MKIIVRDLNSAVVEAAKSAGLDAEVESITAAPAKSVVSPANSFGFMDGGVDYAYSQYFGWGLQDRVQQKISEYPFGELLVGQAFVISTKNETIPNLIVAPTMRVPKIIHDPADIMLATRAAVAAAHDAGISEIVFPGMGTGCGQVRPEVAAAAMRAGMALGLSKQQKPAGWREAQHRHFNLIA